MAIVPLRRRGRQRVPMELMAKDSNRYVTFSKRRAGLFKKASELCTLCGVEAALIVFSPGNKVFSFGHPTVDGIVNRYMHRQGVEQNQILREYDEDEGVKLLNQQLTLSRRKNELEMKKAEELLEFRKSRDSDLFKFTRPEQLTLEELKQSQQVLEFLKDILYHHITMLEEANPHRVANFRQDIMTGQLLAYQQSMFGGQGVMSDPYPNPHHMPVLGQDIMRGESSSYPQTMLRGEGVTSDPNLNPNLGPQTFNNLPQMVTMPPPSVGGQGVMPNPNPNPGPQTFGELSQMTGGPNDYPSMRMFSNPTMEGYENPQGIQQFQNPNYGAPSSNVSDMMGIGLGQNPNMMQPPFQMAPHPVEGQFNGYQNVSPPSMPMNQRPGGGYFTDLLLFSDDDEPALPASYNPQGGNGFGPQGGNGFGHQGGNDFGPQGGNGFGPGNPNFYF